MTRRPWPWWLGNPLVPRLLRWALAIALTGMGCVLVSLVFSFTWVAAGGRGGWLTASRWLGWCGYGCAAIVWVIALALWWRKRHRARAGRTP